MSAAKSHTHLIDAEDDLDDVVLTVNEDYASRLEVR